MLKYVDKYPHVEENRQQNEDADDFSSGPGEAGQYMDATENVGNELPGSPAEKALSIYDPLRHYLMEIRRFPFLTREEEQELTQKYYKTKDSEFASRIILANLRFVVTIAMKYKNTGGSLLDLIQEGNIGLMQAIKKFDPYKDVRVITYASWWIRAAILKYILSNWRLVKLGTTQNERKLFYRLMKEKGRLEAQGITDSMPLLEERLKIGKDEIVDMQHRLEYRETSLDTPAGDREDGEAIGMRLSHFEPTSEEQIQQKQLSALFRQKLKEFEAKLNERDREILHDRILASNRKTLGELSLKFNISSERIRQLEQKTINNFKKFMKTEIQGFDTLFKDMLRLDDDQS